MSFKTPTSLGEGEAGFAVRAHEGEHVRNEQIRAQQQGREVVAQSVVIHTGLCPECGRTYVAGGETRTTTRAKAQVPTPGAVFNAIA